MVDLNFTLVLQLVLFLVFVWAMKRWIYRPLLQVMDERERCMTEAKEKTKEDQQEAASMEEQYAFALAQSYRKANQVVVSSLQKKQSTLMEDRVRVRREHDGEVSAVRAEMNAVIDQEREAFPELTQTIAQAMVTRLGLRGRKRES